MNEENTATSFKESPSEPTASIVGKTTELQKVIEEEKMAHSDTKAEVCVYVLYCLSTFVYCAKEVE